MRNSTIKNYRHQCETLEIRRLLAGNVTAEVIDGDLVLKGDQYGNQVTVDQIDLPARSVRVTPYATEINGSGSFKSEVFSGVTRGIRARLGLGDDGLTLQGLGLAGGLEVIAGAGRDSILLSGVSLGGGIYARTKMDVDSFQIYDSSIGGDVAIYTGRGADVVSFDGVTFGGQLRVGTLRGWDSIATGDSALPEAAVLDAGSGQNLVTSNGTIRLDYDFANDEQGWAAGFSDYPAGQVTAWDSQGNPIIAEEAFNLQSGIRPLPDEMGSSDTAFLLSGRNLSDDLFMYMNRELSAEDGIVAGRKYLLYYDLTFSTNHPGDDGTVQAFYLKAGSLPQPPELVADPRYTGPIVKYRLNADIGVQSNDGLDASVVGMMHNGLTFAEGGWQFHSRSVLGTHRNSVVADAQGRLRLLVGMDSAYEITETLYMQQINARLIPVN